MNAKSRTRVDSVVVLFLLLSAGRLLSEENGLAAAPELRGSAFQAEVKQHVGLEARATPTPAGESPGKPELRGSAFQAEVKQHVGLEARATAAPAGESPGKPEVRLVGHKTDVARRYRSIIPPLPFPPFTTWRQWFRDHEDAVHCALEWRTENGEWFHGELRSTHFDSNAEQYRVGWGEFPGTAYDAYGVYIVPGRIEREKDSDGKPIEITVDEALPCDYRTLEREIRGYAAKHAIPGAPGTGGYGKKNVGLGGPAYKASQNSNTMVKYVLRACGTTRPAPDKAVGWDTEPKFPYSSDADSPTLDSRP